MAEDQDIITAADVGALPDGVVSAAGTAHGGRRRGPNMVEAAMSAVILDAEKECAAIWAQEDIGQDEKRAKIAAIMDPEEIKRRKLEVRKQIKDAVRLAAATPEGNA